MLKKRLSLLLVLCMLAGCLPAFGAEEEALAYRFSFTLRLNEEALSPELRERAAGYAELLNALLFEGKWAQSRTSSAFSLDLSIIPLATDASPISVQMHGTPAFIFVKSPLLGSEEIVLSNDSLLEFCVKGFQHLGVPFQYAALLYPYVWESALHKSLKDWRKMTAKIKPNGRISRRAVKKLVSRWEKRLSADRPLQFLSTSIGLDTGFDEAFQTFLAEIPSWFMHQVTGEKPIVVRMKGNKEVWSSGNGRFAVLLQEPDHTSISLRLPQMESGFLPSFSFERVSNQFQQSGQLNAQILQMNGLEDDLLKLHLSFLSLPTSWPADCSSLVNLNLTGGLFPNIGFSAYLLGKADGTLTLNLCKPSVTEDPGATLLTIAGYLLPEENPVTVIGYTQEEFDRCTDILRVNDVTLAVFVSKIMKPFASGMIRFLNGVPTSGCQAVLDDLTDSGVISLLLGD